MRHTFGRRARLALLALPFVAVVGAPSAWAASIAEPVTLTGVASCDATTGNQVVAWTLTNPSGTDLTIDSAVVDGSGMTKQGPIDTTATMSPTTVLNNGTSTGTTAVTGDGTGDLHLVITYTLGNSDPQVDGEVVMPGGCVKAAEPTTTTTTAVAPEPTPAPAPAVAAVARPAFTG